MKKEMSPFVYDLQDELLRDLINAYDKVDCIEDVDSMVEHLCENLIGQTVIVVNYPELDRLFTNRELIVEKVQSAHLYGTSDGLPVKIYIPYNYIYHPAILAALKCL